MKNIQSVLLRTAAAAAIVGLGAPAIAGDYSANIELNNTYRSNYKVYGAAVPVPGEVIPTTKRGLEQDGRVEFNASGKIGEDVFVAGKGTFLAKKDGTCSIDDMWFQLGNKSFDVKLGRFEAYNLFPTPGDVLLDHASSVVYQTNTLRGRRGNSGNYAQGQFHAAGTFKSDFGLAFELGVIEFKQTPQTETSDSYTASLDATKGFRPVVSYTSGALSLAVGAEAIKYGNGKNEVGMGATVGYDFGFMALNGNVAFGKEDNKFSGHAAHKNTTFGITGSSKIGLAGGVILASNSQDEGTVGGKGKVTTVYASYTHSLFDLKGATWSLGADSSTRGGSYKRTSRDGGHNESGMRLRFNYAF